MADNYLEKRMADYQSGRTSGPAPRPASRPAPGRARLPYPHRNVLVTGADTPCGRAVVAQFVAAGCSVAFTAAVPAAGTDLARSAGGRYFPMTAPEALERLRADSRPTDVAVVCDGQPVPAPRVIVVTDDADFGDADPPGAIVLLADNPLAAAWQCLTLAHRDIKPAAKFFDIRTEQ